MQKLYPAPEAVTKVYRNGDAGPRFDGRHDAGHAVMSSMTRGFCFTFEKVFENKS